MQFCFKKIKTVTSLMSEAFLVATETNILAAHFLLTEYKFDYVLPVVNSTDLVEKLFGLTRQRTRGSFYIDIIDVTATAKM